MAFYMYVYPQLKRLLLSRGIFVVPVVRVLVTKPELLSRNSNYRTRVTALGGKKIIRIISVQLLVSFIFGDFF